MPTNTQVTAALQAQNVPPDRECVQNLTEVIQGVVDFVSIVTTAGETPGSPTDSIAQQALQVANVALATANQALAATPNKRSSGVPLLISSGDSTLNISWSPAFPNTNYEVRGTYFGTNVPVAAFYAFRIVIGSQTVSGCTLRFDNTPVGSQFAWVVEAL